MKTKILRCILSITITLAVLAFISCDNKKRVQEDKISEIQESLPVSSETQNEKEIVKAQEAYDKKGMDGFCKYLEKNSYFAIKDASQNGATPLLIAVKNGELEKATIFLQKGASVDEKDLTGNGLLDYALESSNPEALTFAIDSLPISFWNIVDSKGWLPFVKVVVQCSDFATIKKCIDLTNDINCADKNGKTPLMYAAQLNVDVRTVKYLLDKGAKIDIKNSNEWSALMYAARYNPNPAVMEDLILRGANSEPNSVGLTVTMLAACNQNPGVLLTLLKYKDEINVATDKGKTALMYACENNQNASVIKMLIDNGADLSAKDSVGKTVREYMSANTSLSASDMGIAWKTLEENISEKSEATNEEIEISSVDEPLDFESEETSDSN